MAAPSGVIVLESSDDERVPTEDEVNEYAEFLGLDRVTESHLMWIAREGVVAPVLPPWKACTENGDDVFYFNFETGESVWDHPSDERYRQMVEEYRARPRAGPPPGNEQPATQKPTKSPNQSMDDSVDKSLDKLLDKSLESVKSFDSGDMNQSSENASASEKASDNGDMSKNDISASVDGSSLLSVPEGDTLDLPDSSGLTKKKGLMDLAPLKSVPKSLPALNAGGKLPSLNTPGVLASTGLDAAAEKKRLEAIINEISDEEDLADGSVSSAKSGDAGSISPKAEKVPDASPDKAPAASPERGSAGVGLAPAGLADVSLDKSAEMDESVESSNASPVAAGSGRSIQAGGPKLNGSTGSIGGKSGTLEQSAKSSNLSEVSEDFPSDFERSETSQRAINAGDSLEISATMDGGDALHSLSLAAAAAEGGILGRKASKQHDDGSNAASSNLSRVKDELSSLERVLVKLREIRGQQREYLQLLKSGG